MDCDSPRRIASDSRDSSMARGGEQRSCCVKQGHGRVALVTASTLRRRIDRTAPEKTVDLTCAAVTQLCNLSSHSPRCSHHHEPP